MDKKVEQKKSEKIETRTDYHPSLVSHEYNPGHCLGESEVKQAPKEIPIPFICLCQPLSLSTHAQGVNV